MLGVVGFWALDWSVLVVLSAATWTEDVEKSEENLVETSERLDEVLGSAPLSVVVESEDEAEFDESPQTDTVENTVEGLTVI